MKRILVFFMLITAMWSWSEDVKLWGTPTWAGNYEAAALVKANEWSMSKFGITWELKGALPQGVPWVQAFQMMLSTTGGVLPDIIAGGRLDSAAASNEIIKIFTDLAKSGKLLKLDKYFNDKKNYPHLAAANKETLRPYMYNGSIYAVPGWGWMPKDIGTAWAHPMWNIRYDVAEAFGLPTTLAELRAVLVKAKDFTDLEGKPVLGLGARNLGDMPSFLSPILDQANGGGWEVTPDKKLLPVWATESYAQNLGYLNELWRAGLVDPGLFTNNGEKAVANDKLARYTVMISGGNASYREGTLKAEAKKRAKDDPKMPELIAKQYVNFLHPIQDNPGLVLNDVPGMTMISARTKYPDQIMKVMDWLISDEGIVTSMAEPGVLGVDWEWKPAPVYWQNIGKEPGNQDMGKGGAYRSGADALKNPPLVVPLLQYMTTPAYSTYYEWVHYNPDHKEAIMGQFGVQIGAPKDKYSALEWSRFYCDQVAKIVSPLPSYRQAITEIPANEIAAFATAQQRLNEWIPRMVTAKTVDEYENLYVQWMKVMIGIADWKAIYAGKQARWEAWMKANKVDDRAQLKASIPVRAWADASGAYRYPY